MDTSNNVVRQGSPWYLILTFIGACLQFGGVVNFGWWWLLWFAPALLVLGFAGIVLLIAVFAGFVSWLAR